MAQVLFHQNILLFYSSNTWKFPSVRAVKQQNILMKKNLSHKLVVNLRTRTKIIQVKQHPQSLKKAVISEETSFSTEKKSPSRLGIIALLTKRKYKGTSSSEMKTRMRNVY